MFLATVHAVCSTYSLPVLVFAFQNPLISPLSLNSISYYGNWSGDMELGDIHMEGMLPRNLNIDWMVICQHCIWLRFCKNPQKVTEGKEVSAEVMMKETPNPPTGMLAVPWPSWWHSPVTQREKNQRQAVLDHRTVDSSQELLCIERNTQGHYSFCGEL